MELDLIGQDLSSLQEIQWERAERCESVNVHFNRLTSLRGLPPLTSLTELNLSSNHFKSCDLPELMKLSALVTLDLSGNKISSLRNMPYLPQLRNLSVAFNFITNLDGIQLSVPYLEQLDVRGNQIAKSYDLDPLADLAQLRVLFIGGPQQNPVCNRIPNMTRLFQICEALQLVDDKTKSEWRNYQLLDAPTPRFDELLKSRSHPNTASSKKSANRNRSDDYQYQQQQQLLLRSVHTPSTSKVLFPNRQYLDDRLATDSARQRSPRYFDFEEVPPVGEISPRSQMGSAIKKSRRGHHDDDDVPEAENHRTPQQLVHRRQPQSHPRSESSLPTNPWSRGVSYDDGDVEKEYHDENWAHQRVHQRRPIAQEYQQQLPQEKSNQRNMDRNEYDGLVDTPFPSTSKQTLLSGVKPENEKNKVNSQEPPSLTVSTIDNLDQDQRNPMEEAASSIPSPTKSVRTVDSDFRDEEHQLSLKLVSSVMTLSALTEKNALAKKMQAFNTIRLDAIRFKAKRQLQEKQRDLDNVLAEKLRLQEAHDSTLAQHELALQHEREKYDSLHFHQQQQDLMYQDLRRENERIRAVNEALESEKDAYVHELVEVKQLMNEVNVRLIDHQKKELQWNQQMNTKDEELRQKTQQIADLETQKLALQKETEYCQYRIQANDEAITNFKASIQVLQDTLVAKDESLAIKDHEREVLKNKLAEFTRHQEGSALSQQQSLLTMRQEMDKLQEKNQTLQRQVEEFQSRRLESRLLTLQKAFDEITQHNQELQKEVSERKIQHSQDRKVMKELSKCVKKLQEIDSYRKEQVCQQCPIHETKLREQQESIHQLQLDYSQLLRQLQHRQTQDDSMHENQQRSFDAQKHQLLEQLQRLEKTVQEIDAAKQQLETALQVKDVVLKDQTQQIQEMKRAVQHLEEENQDLKVTTQEYEEKVEELRGDIAELEDEISIKVQMEQKVKRIIRDYLRQELRRQQQEEDNDREKDGEDGNDDIGTRNKQFFDRQRLSRSIELLSTKVQTTPPGQRHLKKERRGSHNSEHTHRSSSPPQEEDWMADADYSYEKHTANTSHLHQLSGLPPRGGLIASSGRGGTDRGMADEEFLALLEDIDGIALAQFHHSDRKPGKDGNRRRNSNSRLDEIDVQEDEDSDEMHGRSDRDRRQHQNQILTDNKSEKKSHSGGDSVCHSLQCQKQRQALEQALQESYQRLAQQQVDFERALAAKNEEYDRVSESLVCAYLLGWNQFFCACVKTLKILPT